MKLLVTGGRGQLGRALVRRAGAHAAEVRAPDVDEVDICDPTRVARALASFSPDAVINAAAYTAVDKAETEPDRAYGVNAEGAGMLAQVCAARGVRLLHISTDYVFDGSATRPYREDDPIAPLGVYGASKAAGERAVHAAGGTVVRTSWLFGAGGPSFVHTMLRLAAERPVLRVVADQHGCPAWSDDLADALLALARRPALEPTYHFCNAGPTTWHGFATAIVAEARRHRALACERIEAIPTSEFPTPARRPVYSVLDTARLQALGIVPPPWTTGLANMIALELG
jgi:dTDP-4-dehydrorhamnose reductase